MEDGVLSTTVATEPNLQSELSSLLQEMPEPERLQFLIEELSKTDASRQKTAKSTGNMFWRIIILVSSAHSVSHPQNTMPGWKCGMNVQVASTSGVPTVRGRGGHGLLKFRRVRNKVAPESFFFEDLKSET